MVVLARRTSTIMEISLENDLSKLKETRMGHPKIEEKNSDLSCFAILIPFRQKRNVFLPMLS
jgi:hypothetical protein